MIMFSASSIYSSASSSANGWTEVEPATVMEEDGWSFLLSEGARRLCATANTIKKTTMPKVINRFSVIPPVYANSMQ